MYSATLFLYKMKINYKYLCEKDKKFDFFALK